MSSPERLEKKVPVRSLSETAFKAVCDNLGASFKDEKASASFVCGGTIPMKSKKQIKVYWHNASSVPQARMPLELPITSSGENNPIDQLVADCEAAGFGRNKETIMDTQYRKAGKLEPSQFATTFHPGDYGILDEVSQILVRNLDAGETGLIPRRVEADLYKLNVYSGPSGLFQKHVDTPRSENQIGSLVVCLPSPFKGGNLVVRHNGSELDFPWENHSADCIQWAAFYSDCEHEIKTVSEGHRITLTYNLYAKLEVAQPHSSVLDVKSLPLYGLLKDALQTPGFMNTGGVLGIFCAHVYPHASKGVDKLLPQYLKGADLCMYAALHSFGFKPDVLPAIVLYDKDDYGNGEVYACSYPYRRYGVEFEFNDDARVYIGTNLRPLGVMDNGGEEDYLELAKEFWQDEKKYDKPITWISTPGHPEPAMAHCSYGNEASANFIYSCATIIAEIPEWDERNIMRQLSE